MKIWTPLKSKTLYQTFALIVLVQAMLPQMIQWMMNRKCWIRTIGENERLEGYFCQETVFNLSCRVLSHSEIKLLEKGLDFASIQRKITQPELRKDFNEFCRRMRIKWNVRHEPWQDFGETPAFTVKSSWKPPKGHPNLEVLLSKIAKELFKVIETPLNYSKKGMGMIKVYLEIKSPGMPQNYQNV